MKRLLKLVQFVAVIIMVGFVSSCHKHLSEHELSFIPYKAGDTLVFQSERDNVNDSIFIKEIFKDYPDGEFLLLTYPQIVNVIAEAKDLNYPDRYLPDPILTVTSATSKTNHQAVIHLYFKWCLTEGFFENDLANIPSKELRIGEKLYENVYEFEAWKDVNGAPPRPNYVKKIYWQKENGFIGYQQFDGLTFWRIK